MNDYPRTPLPPPPPPPHNRDAAVIALIFAVPIAALVMLCVIATAIMYRP